MSGTTYTPGVAATPDANQTTATLLSLMTALGGLSTDFVQGSQIRTAAEAIGAVTEIQGVAGEALAFQALVLGAMSLFGIAPAQATAATGLVTFATSIPASAAPVVSQAVVIPSGTIVQTAGGTQFQTFADNVLASGTASVIIGAGALIAGAIGNVAAGAILGTPLTSVSYPLYVTNALAMAGGLDAGSQSSALGVFNARVNSLGLSSPVAVANSPIGLVASGTGEVVQYASAFEPWLAAGSGAGSGTSGFTLYIDNGTGGASPSLIATVVAWLNGSVTTNQSGYRPIGVPFNVLAVTPVYASATVSGVIFPGFLLASAVSLAVSSGVTAYFTGLGIAPAAAYQPQVAGAAADAGMSAFESLLVNLYYSGSSTPTAVVSGGVGTRVILAGLSVNISTGA